MTKLKKLTLFIFILSLYFASAQDSISKYKALIKTSPKNSEYYNILAFQYSSFNKDSCFYYANLAYKIAVNQNDSLQIAEALANLGESKTNLGQPDLVIKNYKEALELFINQKAWFQISKILNRMGIFYNDIAEDTLAEKYYKEAINIQYKHNINQKVEYIFNNLATSLYQQNKYKEALLYLDSALIKYKQHNNTKGISYVYANKSYIYMQNKDFSLAQKYLEKSIKLIRANKDEEKKMNAYKLYTMLYMDLGNYKLAKTYADSSYIQTKKFNLIDLDNSVNHLYYLLYKRFNKAEKSLDYLEKVNHINDSLKTAEKRRLISELRVRFDMELNELEIKNLNNINKLNEYKINSQQNWIWILSIGLFILTALLSVIIFLKREKFKAEKKLVQKNIEQIDSFKPIFKKEDLVEDEDSKYITSKLTDEQKEEIADQINNLFEVTKIYLNPDCSISLLEKELETNKTYISQVINEKFEHNFKTILKEYRIKEATILLIKPENKNLTIEGISRMVGFKSKSAFNNAFKSITGVTPSFFQKQNIR